MLVSDDIIYLCSLISSLVSLAIYIYIDPMMNSISRAAAAYALLLLLPYRQAQGLSSVVLAAESTDCAAQLLIRSAIMRYIILIIVDRRQQAPSLYAVAIIAHIIYTTRIRMHRQHVAARVISTATAVIASATVYCPIASSSTRRPQRSGSRAGRARGRGA